MKILHVFCSQFITGSAAYAIELGEQQATEGNEVMILTDAVNLSDKLQCIQLPIADTSLIQRYKNTQFLKKLINEQDIQVVHAHSRVSSEIAYAAVKKTAAILISTIHERQEKQPFYAKKDVYGSKVIVGCSNLFQHLKEELQLPEAKLVAIPKGIDLQALTQVKRQRSDADQQVVITYVGRFNGLKGENIASLARFVFPSLLVACPQVKIQLVGGEWDAMPDLGKKAIAGLQVLFGDRIQYLGFRNDVAQLMADSDLLIGSGRVAMEGLLLKVPVLALGEVAYHGLVNAHTIEQLIASNFGDIGLANEKLILDCPAILDEWVQLLRAGQYEHADFSNVLQNYQQKSVLRKIMQLYQTVIMDKACKETIPVLMYHAVAENVAHAATAAGVAKQNFEKHLRFFKMRGLTAISFKEYLGYANGSKSIKTFPDKPVIITFDDAYLNNYGDVLPLAQKYGYKGVAFLMGKQQAVPLAETRGEAQRIDLLMDLEQQQSFVAAGWEIGVHAKSHARLSQLPDEQVVSEMQSTKQALEQELQTEVATFVFPFGGNEGRVKALAKQAGFNFTVATDSGGHSIAVDSMHVCSVKMFPQENYFQLYKKTSPWYHTYYLGKRSK